MLHLGDTILQKSEITIRGRSNRIVIRDGGRLRGLKLRILGNGNTVFIDRFVRATDLEIWIEDDDGRVAIGESTEIHGRTHVAETEGRSVNIGAGCLFAYNIEIRTGDSHGIFDMDGQRVNPAADVFCGDKVWVGEGVRLLKGSQISSNSIVATGSIVTKAFLDSNVVVAGVPGSVVRSHVTWKHARLPLESL